MNHPTILDDLSARGLIHDSTDLAELAALLDEGPMVVYCGFDPTADSLHAGNLIGLLALRRFQLAGHRPIALAGGATGMIGDPSGRSDERNFLTDEVLAHNLASITAQIRRFLDFDGSNAAQLVDNRTWTEELTLIDFLRGVGKSFTVNQMVAKESVRSRMEGESGISYTEFSYMLLQANDYAWLNKAHQCRLQIGGSDQWGNITAGIDLVRRQGLPHSHGLTWPLMTRSDGAKFGKSAEGAIWLDANRTSPYAFFQYWMQADDRDVEKYLLQLTLLDVAKVAKIVTTHNEAPHLREAQRRLAQEVTTIVHGAAPTAAAIEATDVVFGRANTAPSLAAYQLLIDEIPTHRASRSELQAGSVTLVDLLANTGIAKSKSDARRTVEQNGVTINGHRPSAADHIMDLVELDHEAYVLVRRGKKQVSLVVFE